MSKIEKDLKHIFKIIFKLKDGSIEKATFNNVKKWDSMNHLNLILTIESTFKIRVEPEESINFLTYKHILKYLKSVLKHKSS